MKKILSVMFALFSATAMYAQSHGKHLMLGVGGSYPQGRFWPRTTASALSSTAKSCFCRAARRSCWPSWTAW